MARTPAGAARRRRRQRAMTLRTLALVLMLGVAGVSDALAQERTDSVPAGASRGEAIAAADRQIWRLSDEWYRMVDEVEEFEPVTAPTAPLSVEQALARGRASLPPGAGAAALAELKGLDLVELQQLAAAMLVVSKPRAALAALLEAQRREPQNGTVLTNLAAVLGHLRMPAEALALHHAARGSSTGDPQPFGVKRAAVALNNQGYALMQLGRWREAEAPLRQAVALDPSFAEASQNLAVVLYQLDKTTQAQRTLRAAVRRAAPAKAVVTTEEGEPGEVTVDDGFDVEVTVPISVAWDLSAGTVGAPLPTAFRVSTWRDYLVESERFIVMWGPRMGERSNGALRRASAAGARISSRPEDLSERLGRTVLVHIENEWDFVSYEEHGAATPGLDPDIASLVQAFHAEHLALRAQVERSAATAMKALQAIGISDTFCEQAEAISNRSIVDVQPAITRYREAARRLYQAAHERSTGLAANLSDPDYHEAALANVELGALGAQLGVETRAMGAYQVMSVTGGCDPDADAEEEEDDEGPAPKAPRCPRSLSGAGLEMKFGKFLTLGVDCEKLKAGLSSGLGIGPFLDIEWGIGPGGKLTIFGGPSASADVGPLSGGFKSGLYITVADGTGVEDFGWRTGPSASAAAGPATTSASLDAVDFSFVNIF